MPYATLHYCSTLVLVIISGFELMLASLRYTPISAFYNFIQIFMIVFYIFSLFVTYRAYVYLKHLLAL